MRLVAALLVCALALPAQTRRSGARHASPNPAPPATAEQAWPIGEITVQGNRILPTDRILQVAGLSVGQRAGKAEFDAARDRLIATGLFETVGYRFEPSKQGTKAFAASFQVVEAPQFFPYRFEALEVDRAAFQAFVRTKEP